MRSARPAPAGVPSWDIAVPARPVRLPGVAMAGFSDRTATLVEVRVVPHPALMVLLDLGDRPLAVDDGAGGRRHGCVAAGLAPPPGARGTGRPGHFSCLQIRLSPLTAPAVLDAAPELSGAVAALDDLWGRDAARLTERLRAARSWDDRFAIAGAELTRRHRRGRVVDPEVAFCWRRMVAARGRVRVEPLAAEVGWSRKRLWSRFRCQIGLTPKRAAQLVRFDHAAHRLAAGDRAAAVAADGGYADQSHLHREVAAFTGATPATVAAAPFLAVDDVAWPARR